MTHAGPVARRLAVLVLVAVGPVGAQIIRPPVRHAHPSAWVSLGVGLAQLQGLHDGSTDTYWDFGSGALQYRVALERAMPGQGAVGVAATFARVPLTYTTGPGASAVCAAGAPCPLESFRSGGDADANVTQVVATFHNGGGALGFHQVIEIAAGAQIYSNFRARRGGRRLPPADPDADLVLSLGYGFGYALSGTTQIAIVQDAGLSVHQRRGLAANENATPRSYTTRIGVRFGLGQ